MNMRTNKCSVPGDTVVGKLYFRKDLSMKPSSGPGVRRVARPWGLLAFFLILIPLEAGVCQPGDRPTEIGSIPLDGRVGWLADPSRTLELEDVLQRSGDFVPVPGSGVNIGSTTDAAWLRVRIEGVPSPVGLLSLSPTFVDFVDVYVAPERSGLTAGDFKHYALGDHRPFPNDERSGLEDVVPLDLAAAGATLVYVRIASVNSTLNISLALYPAADHTLRTTLTSLAYGVWFGGMAVLVIIQLVFFHFDRKPFYILLALSTLGAMMVYAANLGLSRLLLFPDGGRANDVFHSGAVWLGLTASALMTASVLELRRHSRWLLLAFQAGAVIGVAGAVFMLLGHNLLFAPYGTIAIIALSTLAMVQSLRTMNENGLGTRLPAAAFTLLWIGLVATLAQRSGVRALPNWVSQSYGISSLLYTLLLTAALGVRLRAAETRNRLMSAQALESAKAAEQRASALVAERTQELAQAKKVAEDALSAELQSQEQQVRFMEVISHQYRTPLASIRSNVDSIGLSLASDDQVNRGRIQRIRRGVARLVEVLELNLTRSRLQGPAFRADRVPQVLGAIVEAAAARARDLTQDADIVVESSPAAAGARIIADADMLGIAIVNLIENAVKFSPGPAPRVTVSCVIEAGRAVIAVSDSGIGIPSAEIDKVAERFARASNASDIEGTGLGLSLVRRIVAAHGGEVAISSEEGVGTTVRIHLPLA